MRFERDKTDEELRRRRESIEEDADEVVTQARDKADRVLERARDRADQKLEQSHEQSGKARALLAEERDREDTELERERETADGKLREEREAREQALAQLLREERDATDEHLLLERTVSDDTVTARDSLLGVVSHDLRGMLGGIALNTSMLLRHLPPREGGDPTRRYVENIQRFTARMHRLVGDLVDMASIEAGRLAVKPELGDVTGLIQEAIRAFEPAAMAKGISLEAQLPEGALAAKFDHDRILQVLANLLSNAIKFTPAGGRILVRAEDADAEVRFAGSDMGTGIPPDQRQAVFDQFWQAEKGDRRGSGLGLFIARAIVEAHGGRIWVEGKPGPGSTFVFTLARLAEREPPTGGVGLSHHWYEAANLPWLVFPAEWNATPVGRREAGRRRRGPGRGSDQRITFFYQLDQIARICAETEGW